MTDLHNRMKMGISTCGECGNIMSECICGEDVVMNKLKAEEFKRECCSNCNHSHSCKDLDGDLIDGNVKSCMEVANGK